MTTTSPQQSPSHPHPQEWTPSHNAYTLSTLALKKNSIPDLVESLRLARVFFLKDDNNDDDDDDENSYIQFRNDLFHEITSPHLLLYMLDHESIPVHTVRPRGIFQFADKQLIESLVSRGWDIDTRDESTSASPSDGKRLLEYFIRKRYGKEHLARWIIDEKNAAVENTSTSTILETCASFGSVAMFKFLEKRGATLSPGTLHGAVETAASKGVDPDTDADDAEMLRYLVDERGLDVNVIDDNAGTPICCAARWERGVAVVRWLLRKGADPDLEDKDGRDALEFAREGKCHEVLALLEDWKRGG